jgi:hypothetical protein
MGKMKILRVFPRATRGTPVDPDVRINRLPTLWDEADRVEISVVFDKDIPQAERLAKQWEVVTSDVQLGGPAFRDPGGVFVPGRYLKKGYVITSRGCPNSCWFCRAWKQEGRDIRELPITEGHNVQDNNLLACSPQHIEGVFQMLAGQDQTPRLCGGLEAARLEQWHADWLWKLKSDAIWFAYDDPADYEALAQAMKMLKAAGFSGVSHNLCCYVLCGYNSQGRVDTFEAAEERFRQVVRLGFFPQAMLLNNGEDWTDPQMRSQWKEYRFSWVDKGTVGGKMREIRAQG